MKSTVAIVDDNPLLAQALADLVNCFEEYEVCFCAAHGLDLQHQIRAKELPDLVLLDVNRPVMNGIETAKLLHEQYPSVKVLALSMLDDEQTVVTMMQQGVRGYLLKINHPDEVLTALNQVRDHGIYTTPFLTRRLLNLLPRPAPRPPVYGLNDREATFVKMACSELTYVEIADKMCVSPRTVDGYREAVFDKLNVRTRVGLAMLALRTGLA